MPCTSVREVLARQCPGLPEQQLQGAAEAAIQMRERVPGVVQQVAQPPTTFMAVLPALAAPRPCKARAAVGAVVLCRRWRGWEHGLALMQSSVELRMGGCEAGGCGLQAEFMGREIVHMHQCHDFAVVVAQPRGFGGSEQACRFCLVNLAGQV